MKLNFTAALTVLKSTGIVVLLSALSIGKTQAQCGYAVGLGCNNTDYTNFGLNSNSDAATIEYDNFVSGFHSSVIRGGDGKYYVWGEKTGNDGSSNRTSKTEINSTSFSQITGTILKTTMATASTSGTGLIVLTTDGLFAGGTRGNNGVFSTNVSPNTSAFTKLTHSGTYGLPTGVTPSDVKMMFATTQTLAIVTCDGAVWVISQTLAMRGNNNNNASAVWQRVKRDTTGNPDLTNVIAVRGAYGVLIALTSTGELYTWGTNTYLGNNTAQTARSYATLMTAPKTGTIKMIGANYCSSGVSYYVLYTDGELYALGSNNMRQLGDWTNTERRNWVRPRYPNASGTAAGATMDDIAWISPNEHDNWGNAAINVINNDGRLWNFGTNSANMLGRQLTGSSTSVGTNPQNPGQPFASSTQSSHNNFNPSTSTVLAIETGGHTTLQITQCEENFGYIGHAINGSSATNANTTYNTYTYTAEVDVCGADAVASIGYVIEPIAGTGNTICAGQTVYLKPVPPGGTLTVQSGPGVITNGNELNFTANTGTVTLRYQVNTICGPQDISIDLELDNCVMQYVTGKIWIDANENAISETGEPGTNAATLNNTGLWANLVNDDGEVVTAVPVSANGSYSIPQNVTTTGSFSVVITKEQVAGGTIPPASSTMLPAGWKYTGNNPANNIPCLVPTCVTPHSIPVTLTGSGSVGNDFGINGIYKLKGRIFHDPNGLNNNAVDGDEIYHATTPSAYQNQGQPQLYVSMVDNAGKLINYTPILPDGTYEIGIPLDQNVVLRLTTNPGDIGNIAPAPVLPSGWAYAGERFGDNNNKGTGMNDGTGTTGGPNAPITRYNGDIDVTFTNNSNEVTNLDFGIQQPPVADAKTFMVANAYFGYTPMNGYPALGGYKSIAMASAGLSNNYNGSLSGTDEEDCPGNGSCNGNGGSNIDASFVIGTINSNTKLYYDFGVNNGGVQEVFSNSVIEHFDMGKMAIYGANGQGSLGNELGFTYALMDNAGITSPFVSYLITTIEALPLQLLDFTGYAASFTSVLNWNTAKEENVSHFEIMRSTDGRKWNEIGQVKALNNPINNSYNFIDQKPQRGVNYYKLFMKDIDATGSYSKIISVSHDQIAQQIIVSPNPVKDKLTIDFKGFEQQTSVLMTMYNSYGSIVWPQSVYTSTATITMDIAQFASGVYIIEIKTDTDTFIEKIVKH